MLPPPPVVAVLGMACRHTRLYKLHFISQAATFVIVAQMWIGQEGGRSHEVSSTTSANLNEVTQTPLTQNYLYSLVFGVL